MSKIYAGCINTEEQRAIRTMLEAMCANVCVIDSTSFNDEVYVCDPAYKKIRYGIYKREDNPRKDEYYTNYYTICIDILYESGSAYNRRYLTYCDSLEDAVKYVGAMINLGHPWKDAR